MSPLRADVLGVTFVLSLPLLALWWRGDFTADDVTSRLPWCFLAGWGAVALLRFAMTPRDVHVGKPAHEVPGRHDHGGTGHALHEDQAPSA